MGLKRLPPSPWARLRSGRVAGTIVALILFIVGIFAAIAVLPNGGLVALTLLVLPVVAGIVTAYVVGRRKLLPDSFIDEVGREPTYRAEFCKPLVLREACDLTRGSYGGDYVSHQVAEQWRQRNARVFVQIMNQDNQLCAAFGILALRNSFMDSFIAGTLTEQRLEADDICNYTDAKRSTRLYVSGVVVRDPTTYLGHRRVGIMIWAMLRYLKELYGLTQPRELYALAVTKESGRLLAKLGFRVETRAAVRMDKHDLYRFDLTKESWNALLGTVGDRSLMCHYDFRLTRVRKVPSKGKSSTQKISPVDGPLVTTLLFVVGDRGGFQKDQVQSPKEFQAIQAAMKSCANRDVFTVANPLEATTRPLLVTAYGGRPTIIHFAGHGDTRSLSLISEEGGLVTSEPLIKETLARIFENWPQRVRLCVLNTCESAIIAEHIASRGVVDAAVGWQARLSDTVAITFAGIFYKCVGDGLPLSKCLALAGEGAGGNQRPSLYAREGVDVTQLCYCDAKAK